MKPRYKTGEEVYLLEYEVTPVGCKECGNARKLKTSRLDGSNTKEFNCPKCRGVEEHCKWVVTPLSKITAIEVKETEYIIPSFNKAHIIYEAQYQKPEDNTCRNYWAVENHVFRTFEEADEIVRTLAPPADKYLSFKETFNKLGGPIDFGKRFEGP